MLSRPNTPPVVKKTGASAGKLPARKFCSSASEYGHEDGDAMQTAAFCRKIPVGLPGRGP